MMADTKRRIKALHEIPQVVASSSWTPDAGSPLVLVRKTGDGSNRYSQVEMYKPIPFSETTPDGPQWHSDPIILFVGTRKEILAWANARY